MTNRIYEEESLMKEADFTLFLNLKGIYDEKNADGTDASASLRVEATSVAFALSMLSQLSEDRADEILEGLAEFCMEDEGLSLEHKTSETEALFITAFSQNTLPFIEFVMKVKGDYNGKPSTASFAVKAPSYLIAYNSFVALTKKQKLSALAASFMPEEEDDWESQPYLLIS